MYSKHFADSAVSADKVMTGRSMGAGTCRLWEWMTKKREVFKQG